MVSRKLKRIFFPSESVLQMQKRGYPQTKQVFIGRLHKTLAEVVLIVA